MQFKEYKYENLNYKMMVPPVIDSMKLAARVGVIIAPVLSLAGTDLLKNGSEGLMDGLKSMDPIKLHDMLMDASSMSKLTCEDDIVASGASFQNHFDNHRGHVYPVLGWNLWMCVKDFLPGLDSFAPKLKEVVSKAKGQGVSLSQSQKDGM